MAESAVIDWPNLEFGQRPTSASDIRVDSQERPGPRTSTTVRSLSQATVEAFKGFVLSQVQSPLRYQGVKELQGDIFWHASQRASVLPRWASFDKPLDLNRMGLSVLALQFSLDSPEWASSFSRTLLDLLDLDDDWNGRGGRPLSYHAAQAGLSLVQSVGTHLRAKPFAYPSPLGGLILEFGKGQESVTVILENNNALLNSSADDDRPALFDLSVPTQEQRFLAEVIRKLDSLP